MKLNNKIIVITGASSGIGKSLAVECASRGANIVLAARQYDKLCKIGQDLEKQYQIKALAVQCDVVVEADCANLIKQAVATFGKIDVLISNAGIAMRALFQDVELNVLKRVMDVNFWGTVYCTKYAFPEILKTKGSIVGVSSIAGYKGLPGRTGYVSSKFAMNGFLDSLRVENLKTGVHVLTACPGFTTSNIRNVALSKDGTQQGESSMNESKMMSSEKVARMIMNGVENRSRTLIMTGQGKFTVALSKFLPVLLDKIAYRVFSKEKNPLLK
ncbi:SDR family oxidoreductase [Mucilaginibacter gynuensis]|uniref:SDR family oxidoreductase n=1 Tax=Mucilaginibacter gynuensis TaxID=1302236 RepID=A0ABP8GGH6_9SPHI